jgi:hypothetical protein
MNIPLNYTYIVHSANEIERCKIGYWSSTLKSLRARYATSYGGDLKLYTFETIHPILSETAFKLRYQHYNIINELYNITYIEEYKQFFTQISTKNDIDLNDYIIHLYANNMLNFEDVISDIILTCKRCGYETDKVYLYKEHMNRNILCEGKVIIEDESDKKYECIRCDYVTDKLFSFVTHLERKTLCDPIKGDISLDDLKEKYIKPKLLSCNNCNKSFKTPNGLTQHKKICNVNKNIIAPNNMMIEFENMKREIAELRQLMLNNIKTSSNQ